MWRFRVGPRICEIEMEGRQVRRGGRPTWTEGKLKRIRSPSLEEAAESLMRGEGRVFFKAKRARYLAPVDYPSATPHRVSPSLDPQPCGICEGTSGLVSDTMRAIMKHTCPAVLAHREEAAAKPQDSVRDRSGDLGSDDEDCACTCPHADHCKANGHHHEEADE